MMTTTKASETIEADTYGDWLQSQITIWSERQRAGLLPPPLPKILTSEGASRG